MSKLKSFAKRYGTPIAVVLAAVIFGGLFIWNEHRLAQSKAAGTPLHEKELDTLKTLQKAMLLPKNEAEQLVDAWGNRLVLIESDINRLVRSVGPDGVNNTPDDIQISGQADP